MIDSVSNKELYDKFHEFYIAVIKHIICSIRLSRDDGAPVDMEMLHRAQECCLEAFDELNYCMYYRALDRMSSERMYYSTLDKMSSERSPLAVLTYTLSSIDDDELIPVIQEKYKNKLSEEEFHMLGALFDTVSEQLSGFLSSSCKFLVSTNDINLRN